MKKLLIAPAVFFLLAANTPALAGATTADREARTARIEAMQAQVRKSRIQRSARIEAGLTKGRVSSKSGPSRPMMKPVRMKKKMKMRMKKYRPYRKSYKHYKSRW